MPATFTRTLRSIAIDGSRRRTVELAAAALIIVGWVAWFILGRVAVYEVTDRARIEVEIRGKRIAITAGFGVAAIVVLVGCGEFESLGKNEQGLPQYRRHLRLFSGSSPWT